MNLRNLKRSWLLPVALILFLFGNNANAWYSSGADPTSVGPIEVELEDGAKGACWTNLKEVREYAEEKLRNKGYSVVGEQSRHSFIITVGAFRAKSGACIYDTEVEIRNYTYVDGLFGEHVIGITGSFGINPKNANNVIIENVRKMIEQM